MAKQGYAPEQIISKLRKAEVLLSQGKDVAEVSRHLCISEQTYYRWRREQAGRLKELEKENTRLVAELSLDNAILKDVASGNLLARSSANKR